MPTFKEMTQYFQDIGANDVRHTKKTYLAHGIGVYRDIKAWGADEDLCKAALFHSIYGTQQFQGFTLPLEHREELKAFIGERAEWIAFLNCFMDRETLDTQVTEDKEVYPIRHRVTGEMIEVSREDFDDLVRVHLCDMLEQVTRSEAWNSRREAFRNMAERLDGVALEAYDRVFAEAPV
jgi:(p)ppGpp synthase/HD superfamily hydrolase